MCNDDDANVDKLMFFDLDRWQQGGLTSFSQTCFAEYWYKMNRERIIPIDFGTNYSGQKKEILTVDPFSFHHRMALGKFLIEHTGGEEIWGKDFSQHWFWAYLAQLDWQRRSGRLQNPSIWNVKDDIQTFEKAKSFCKDDTISEQSWWGFMNLQFSVAVYCGAVEAGLVPVIQLKNPSVETNIGFQHCVQHWKIFWDTSHQDFVTAVKNSTKAELKKRALVKLYQQLWKTHTSVVLSGVSHGKQLEGILSEEERNMGLGWCNMVELLAAMSWMFLSLDALSKFGVGYLPTMRIAGPETVEWIKVHRPKEYVTIQNLSKLRETSPETMERMCGFWSRVTRWGFQRDTMPWDLDVLNYGNGFSKIMALAKILTFAIAPQSFTEIGVWVALWSALAFLDFRRK
jgi:hypothetical protein